MDIAFHQPWTEQRIERLKILWDVQGLSASQCADELGGTTRNAVISKVHRLGLTRRAESIERRQRLNKARNLAQMRQRILRKARIKREPTAARELLASLPVEPLPPVDTLAPTRSWAELEDSTFNITQCRAMPGDHLASEGKIFCGRPTVVGTSWCECHLRRYASPVFVKTKHPDRPAWQDNRTGSKGAVFLSGREKMKAY